MDELGGSRDPGHLAFWAALALGCAALLSLIGSLLNRWARTEDIMSYWQNERTFADKMMQLDYADVDRQEVYDLYSRIRQNARWSMLGMQQALALFQPMIWRRWCRASAGSACPLHYLPPGCRKIRPFRFSIIPSRAQPCWRCWLALRCWFC